MSCPTIRNQYLALILDLGSSSFSIWQNFLNTKVFRIHKCGGATFLNLRYLGILTNTGKRTGPQGWNTVQITIDQIGLVLWYNKVP